MPVARNSRSGLTSREAENFLANVTLPPDELLDDPHQSVEAIAAREGKSASATRGDIPYCKRPPAETISDSRGLPFRRISA
jgi:hypothetical protein